MSDKLLKTKGLKEKYGKYFTEQFSNQPRMTENCGNLTRKEDSVKKEGAK